MVRRILPVLGLLLIAASCRTTPLDNVWPGCQVCTPVQEPVVGIPTSCRIEERVSPRVDCNPVMTQHTLVVTVLDQCGNPLPGQRVEWMLARYPEAVGDIVAVDDQYGAGRIAPMAAAFPGNNGNKIDNQYAVSVTNWGPELLDAGNNHPYEDHNGVRLPDITVGTGETWLTITSTREGVTDMIIYVPGIRDGTKHKCWAKKIWADFNVTFPDSAVNTLPDDVHSFPVTITRADGSGIPGQPGEAEILDGPDATFASGGRTQLLDTNAAGVAEFSLRNSSGATGTNRIKFTALGSFYGATCPRSRIITKTWRRASLEVACEYPGGPTAAVGRSFTKRITVRNTGDAPAEAVMLDDTPQGGMVVADGTSFPINLGTIPAGQQVTRSVAFQAQSAGQYTNTVRVTSSTSGASASNTCPIEITQGKLEITKVCDPVRAQAGSEVRFVVTVTNTGRAPLENVVVVDTYPEGIKPTTQNTASLGTLVPGDSQDVIFAGIAEAPGTYTNVARATADGVPEVQAQCTLEVVKCELQMELVGPPNIYFGELANFTLKVTNVGDGAAEGCTVRVSYGGCLGGGFEDVNIGPMAPGEVWTHDWSKKAIAVGPCQISADSNCGARCAIRRDADIRVTGLTALQVEMTDKAKDGREEGIFNVGETFVYRLRVENDAGTERTPEINVSWQLPPELEFVSGKNMSGELEVTGAGQSAQTANFVMAVGGKMDFEILVRVVSAPASTLVKTVAVVQRASDGAELASESESTTLRN
ncbi:MAG: DUF11 domain-containing protein [Planctomycetota bacterium]|nr:DUF11 domain-containing protein [Planctomycetota bacterium]